MGAASRSVLNHCGDLTSAQKVSASGYHEELDVQRVVLRILLICLLGGMFGFFAPVTADAETKVHRKAEGQAVRAELFVTSW